MKVLIVEDDRKLSRFLSRAFAEEGYNVDLCRTGAEAVRQATDISYDLMVLDWMLPEGDGLSVCRELRRIGNRLPIMMLTARGEVGEKVLALDAGADDYVTKPFHLDEMLARARSLTRRASGPMEGVLRAGPVSMELQKRLVYVDNQRVDLTAREFSLLTLLVKRAGRVVTRSEILAQVWEMQHDPGSNVIDVHIRNLREKLGSAARCIETIRGQGYLFAIPPATGASPGTGGADLPSSVMSTPRMTERMSAPLPVVERSGAEVGRSGPAPADSRGRPEVILGTPSGPVVLSSGKLPSEPE